MFGLKIGNLKFAGKGIDFSATSDATGSTSELLDDYEEGTFGPIARGRTMVQLLQHILSIKENM